jgi:hypothetical protein
MKPRTVIDSNGWTAHVVDPPKHRGRARRVPSIYREQDRADYERRVREANNGEA